MRGKGAAPGEFGAAPFQFDVIRAGLVIDPDPPGRTRPVVAVALIVTSGHTPAAIAHLCSAILAVVPISADVPFVPRPNIPARGHSANVLALPPVIAAMPVLCRNRQTDEGHSHQHSKDHQSSFHNIISLLVPEKATHPTLYGVGNSHCLLPRKRSASPAKSTNTASSP